MIDLGCSTAALFQFPQLGYAIHPRLNDKPIFLDGVYRNPDTLSQQAQRIRITLYHLIYGPCVRDLTRLQGFRRFS